MPNKHKLAKLRNKLLSSGKLKTNKDVKETMKQLQKKAQIDNEGIDYEFEKAGSKNFEKLEDSEKNNRKFQKLNKAKPFGFDSKNNKKRKLVSNQEASVSKKQKPNDSSTELAKPTALENLPKKCKKNKYFLMAHPELAKTNEKNSNVGNIIVDREKMNLNKLKIIKKKISKKTIPSNKKFKKKKLMNLKSNNLWLIDECSSSDEVEHKVDDDIEPRELDLSNIEKNFMIKETMERLDDGTVIKVFKPVLIEDSDANEESEEESNEKSVKKEYTQVEEIQKSEHNPLIDKLKSSRFRYLNELFYTHPSEKSFEYFQNDEDAFKAYHEGFKAQASKWPINPLDEIIKYIKNRSANLVVADFGCGEAKLAQQVSNKVHSFDFVSLNDLVTKCDMKNVPLNSQSCDIVVFCLSLMGTNLVDFLCEAHRVLKPKGVLKIAEVVSRIQDKPQFIRDIESIGFKLVSDGKNKGNSDTKSAEYFYFFDFVKMSSIVKSKPNIKLTACLYKKR